MTRLRIFVFQTRPDALLVHIPADHIGPLVLPPLPTPFALGDVAKACGDAGIDATVRESVPGRWTYALEKAKRDGATERSSKAKQQFALRASIMRGSLDQWDRDRAAVMQQKIETDAEIADLKKKIGVAKSNVHTRGTYMAPADFRRLEARLETARLKSQALQVQMGKLRDEEKARNIARSEQETKSFERRFIDVAKEFLDEETFRDIVDAAQEEEDEESSPDSQ